MTKVLVQIGLNDLEGELVGIFQHSVIIAPSITVGGGPGGTVAYPVAVVRVGRDLIEVKTKCIKYL